MSQKLKRTFRKSGDSPCHPYILRLAFTGNATKLINGQTLHSVFHFRFDDKILSMSDKQRDKVRTSLQNLKVIIIDEISLVKSDMLYQLHFRLAREIMQRPDLPFGGVSVILLGDLLQIRPVNGKFVFQAPNNKELELTHMMDSLWEKFEVITLKTNHRQGEDKPYADLLNRVRFGEQTVEDFNLLRTRVFMKDSDEIPKNALMVTGTNAKVIQFNPDRLNEIDSPLEILTATVYNDTKGIF